MYSGAALSWVLWKYAGIGSNEGIGKWGEARRWGLIVIFNQKLILSYIFFSYVGDNATLRQKIINLTALAHSSHRRLLGNLIRWEKGSCGSQAQEEEWVWHFSGCPGSPWRSHTTMDGEHKPHPMAPLKIHRTICPSSQGQGKGLGQQKQCSLFHNLMF